MLYNIKFFTASEENNQLINFFDKILSFYKLFYFTGQVFIIPGPLDLNLK